MEAVESLLVDRNLTNLKTGNLQLSAQVIDAEKTIPATALSASPAQCCARTCTSHFSILFSKVISDQQHSFLLTGVSKLC